MMGTVQTRRLLVALAVVLLLSLALLAGCGSKDEAEAPAPSGPTAKGNLAIAESALETMAPDAKLLLVQTAQAASATGTPVWAYLFGSPSDGNTYVVYVTNGSSMGAQSYGTAGLSPQDWKAIPGLDKWKIDSDEAYEKALAASGAKGDPDQYTMGFITYKPATDTSTIEPFVWRVQFAPGKSGASGDPINVNATTGEAKVGKE